MIRTRYDTLTMGLHWLIALLIAGDYALILIREEMPRGPARTEMLSTHMAIGLMVFALVLLRLFWRPFAPKLAPVAQKPLLSSAAKTGHIALYALMIALPLGGLISAWLKGRGVSVFGLFALPSPLAANKELGEQIEELHGLAGHAIMILAGLHALAAIGHQWILKDGTLGRMLPGLAAAKEA